MQIKLLLTIALLAAPGTTRAQKGGPARPPESLVKACLANCQAQSSRCSRSVREAEKQSKSSSKAKPRSRSLRQCGCAFVGCKLMCKRHALGVFSCSGFTKPMAPPRMKTSENACKKSQDCTLMPSPAPCSCEPCGVFWLRAVNKQALRAWKSKWDRRRCAVQPCPACDRWAIGRGSYCLNGTCRVQP